MKNRQAIFALLLTLSSGMAQAAIRAGVGVVDATGLLGASSGQYADMSTGTGQTGNGGRDPQNFSTAKLGTYGVASRTTARALVVEGSNGGRVALLTSDSYLAQDLLLRRVGQLLAAGSSGIGYGQLLHSASHNHSSPYQLTQSAGVWVFQDAYNAIAFEQQATALTQAVEMAVATLKPARMGATVVQHSTVKDNIVGPVLAQDGTPAGYPRDFNDNDLTILRFDDLSGATPKPLAVWMNFGQHPEGLDGQHVVSGDFVAPMQRFFERATGAPLLFAQGDVGSSEGPYDREGTEMLPEGIRRAWAHVGWGQLERAGHILSRAVLEGFEAIGRGDASVRVPFTSDFPVAMQSLWHAGPVSHPYPSVSNCNSAQTFEGDPGAPVAGFPDCSRAEDNGFPGLGDVFGPVFGNAPGAVPLPGHYDAPGHPAVEENQRLHLQTARLGEVLLASCACEAQVDLILNLKSRANLVQGDQWLGFDYSCLLPENFSDPLCAQQLQRYAPTPERIARLPGAPQSLANAAKVMRMRAQIHNDAAGWDTPANAPAAQGQEPDDPADIWGNFTHEELPAERGYSLVVGLGHTGDYNGYTLSYREYVSRDSYRKALTAYGPHTADFMVTRLVRMAGSMKGGPAVPADPLAGQAAADEQRQQAQAMSAGQASGARLASFKAALPNDAGVLTVLAEPQDITRLSAATFHWRGGANSHDNPVVTVERETTPGVWQAFADQTGEVQSFVQFPASEDELLAAQGGQFEWRWTAVFEAFDPTPAAIGQTPVGRYRFVARGQRVESGSAKPYLLTSAPFTVSPWPGVVVRNGAIDAGRVRVTVEDSVYPRSYPLTGFAAIADDARETICRTCTFRPWAKGAPAASVTVEVTRADGRVQQVTAVRQGSEWVADAQLAIGDSARIAAGGAKDAFGEINGAALVLPAVTQANAAAPGTQPPATPAPTAPLALIGQAPAAPVTTAGPRQGRFGGALSLWWLLWSAAGVVLARRGRAALAANPSRPHGH